MLMGKLKLKTFVILSLFLGLLIGFSVNGFATTWYVRPAGGDYGSENGTSYANAWDGLNNVVWGVGGVVAGDTLYVCGLHLRIHSSGSHVAGWMIPVSGSAGNPITIRGDYAGDAGTVWGGAVYAHEAWVDEGSNTYSITIVAGHYADYFFEDVTESSWTVLAKATSIANCQATVGSHYSVNYGTGTKLYIHCSDNAVPTNRITVNRWGYRFNTTNKSYITFQDLKFYSIYRWIETASGAGSHQIWDGCTLQYGDDYGLIVAWAEYDNFEVKNCTLAWAKNGIYTVSDGPVNNAPDNYVFSGNTIHDMGVRLTDQGTDAHGIGIQNGVGGLVEDNYIYNCGSGITLYAKYEVGGAANGMSNNIVRRNFIKDLHTNGGANARGIETGCDNACLEDKSGNEFYLNIISNCKGGASDEGIGFRMQFEDEQTVYNNVVHDCDYGFQTQRNIDGTGANVKLRNNVFFNNSIYHIDWNTGATTFTINSDYNSFYLVADDKFRYISTPQTFTEWQANSKAGCTFDPNSITGDPVFQNAGGFYDLDTDFILQKGSPCRDKGTNVGLKKDYRGTLVPKGSAPDIGAYEYFKAIIIGMLRWQ